MDIYAHVSKRQTEKTAIRFADFMKESDQKNELFRYGKNAKKQTISIR
ncbi:Tyrosine recombinase XerC (fragment) [Listeria monocytogenes]